LLTKNFKIMKNTQFQRYIFIFINYKVIILHHAGE
jgi:hypothetical protein